MPSDRPVDEPRQEIRGEQEQEETAKHDGEDRRRGEADLAGAPSEDGRVRGESGVERREEEERQHHRAVEEPVDDEGAEGGAEAELGVPLREAQGARELTGASGDDVVHHHPNRGRLPEGAQRDARPEWGEDRLPATGAEREDRGGGDRAEGPEQTIRPAQPQEDISEGDVAQGEPEEPRAEDDADEGTDVESHRHSSARRRRSCSSSIAAGVAARSPRSRASRSARAAARALGPR
jgi:hypothetical protein